MKLAYHTGRKPSTMNWVLNVANEMAVELFREEKVHFLNILRINQAMMDLNLENLRQTPTLEALEDMVHFDIVTRTITRALVDAGNLRRSIKAVS